MTLHENADKGKLTYILTELASFLEHSVVFQS